MLTLYRRTILSTLHTRITITHWRWRNSVHFYSSSYSISYISSEYHRRISLAILPGKNRFVSTSLPLSYPRRCMVVVLVFFFLLRTGDQYGDYHEVRPHGLTVARSEKINEKKFNRHFYGHRLRCAERQNSVFGPCRSPPLYKSLVTCPRLPPPTAITSFLEKRCTSLYFSRIFSVSPLSLFPCLTRRTASVFFVFSAWWWYSLPRLPLCYIFLFLRVTRQIYRMKYHTACAFCVISFLTVSRSFYSEFWMTEFARRRDTSFALATLYSLHIIILFFLQYYF